LSIILPANPHTTNSIKTMIFRFIILASLVAITLAQSPCAIDVRTFGKHRDVAIRPIANQTYSIFSTHATDGTSHIELSRCDAITIDDGIVTLEYHPFSRETCLAQSATSTHYKLRCDTDVVRMEHESSYGWRIGFAKLSSSSCNSCTIQWNGQQLTCDTCSGININNGQCTCGDGTPCYPCSF
jgi:hypothetical protein